MKATGGLRSYHSYISISYTRNADLFIPTLMCLDYWHDYRSVCGLKKKSQRLLACTYRIPIQNKLYKNCTSHRMTKLKTTNRSPLQNSPAWSTVSQYYYNKVFTQLHVHVLMNESFLINTYTVVKTKYVSNAMNGPGTDNHKMKIIKTKKAYSTKLFVFRFA